MGLFTRVMYNPHTIGDHIGNALLEAWDTLNPVRMKVCMHNMCRRLGIMVVVWWYKTLPDINLRNSNSRSTAIFTAITSLILTLVCEIKLDYFLYLSTQHFMKSAIFYAHMFHTVSASPTERIIQQSHIWVLFISIKGEKLRMGKITNKLYANTDFGRSGGHLIEWYHSIGGVSLIYSTNTCSI